MRKYGLIGKLKAVPGKGQELEKILIQAADLMKSADGCLVYLVGRAEDDNDRVEVIEVWNSKDDHDASLSYPGVKELIGKAMPLLDGPPEQGTEISILGGYGIA